MPCYHPVAAFRPRNGGPLLFTDARHDCDPIRIPCGRCIGCRLKRSRDWAIRCLHEKQMHKRNCFLTLTYDDQHIPPGRTLNPRDFVLFMKRLRKHADTASECPSGMPLGGKIKSRLRFYMCGEYGDLEHRPHYHALIFGYDFPDKIFATRSHSGEKIYNSRTLEKLWTLGHSSIGEITFNSAAYVARYVMKKQTGDQQGGQNKQHYILFNIETFQYQTWKRKEYNTMSRRPGIGSPWLEKYASDIRAKGKVILRGHQHNPPRYYDKQFKKLDQQLLEQWQYERYLEQLAQTEHHTPERLHVQEQVQAAQLGMLKRKLQ